MPGSPAGYGSNLVVLGILNGFLGWEFEERGALKSALVGGVFVVAFAVQWCKTAKGVVIGIGNDFVSRKICGLRLGRALSGSHTRPWL